MTGVTITPTRIADAAGFHAALDSVARERQWLSRNEAPPLEKTVAFMEKILAEGHVQLLARDGNTIIGWCDIFPRSDDATVGMVGMGLVKAWRGQGIGEKLLRMALDQAHGRFQRIQLDVRTTNTTALSLYKKLGFVIEGSHHREIPGVEADLYTMVWQP